MLSEFKIKQVFLCLQWGGQRFAPSHFSRTSVTSRVCKSGFTAAVEKAKKSSRQHRKVAVARDSVSGLDFLALALHFETVVLWLKRQLSNEHWGWEATGGTKLPVEEYLTFQ